MSARRPDAILVLFDYRTLIYRQLISEFVATNQLPTMFGTRESVDAGGLMSYGSNLGDLAYRAAGYVDKILKGAKPTDLPIGSPPSSSWWLILRLPKRWA